MNRTVHRFARITTDVDGREEARKPPMTLAAQPDTASDHARSCVLDCRGRIRHLVELGSLVEKSGLVDLAKDDRATVYGALLDLVGRARSVRTIHALASWRRRGRRAIDAQAAGSSGRVAGLLGYRVMKRADDGSGDRWGLWSDERQHWIDVIHTTERDAAEMLRRLVEDERSTFKDFL